MLATFYARNRHLWVIFLNCSVFVFTFFVSGWIEFFFVSAPPLESTPPKYDVPILQQSASTSTTSSSSSSFQNSSTMPVVQQQLSGLSIQSVPIAVNTLVSNQQVADSLSVSSNPSMLLNGSLDDVKVKELQTLTLFDLVFVFGYFCVWNCNIFLFSAWRRRITRDDVKVAGRKSSRNIFRFDHMVFEFAE